MDKSGQTLALSLISHTNVGKTTLARTLLRKDVGEVDDRAHVTEISEAHQVIRSPEGYRMLLWDTPGFGDSVRLIKRLRQSGNPLGWFLSSVWDKVRDRPFWCSQQAVKNIRAEADVVLYLVNATESPESASYVNPELEVIEWLDKPVLALVNQTGPAASREIDEGVERWRRFFSDRSYVKACLPLDAFARCWVQEQELFRHVARAAPRAKRSMADSLSKAWEKRSREIFESSMESIGRQLAVAAADEVKMDNVGIVDKLRDFISRAGIGGGDRTLGLRDCAMGDLAERLDVSIMKSMNELIHLHGLKGDVAEKILERIRENFSTKEPVPEGIAAVLGGFVSGALGGLAADIAAGGMTFGGGAVAGGILGAAGAGGLAKGYNLIRGNANVSMRWSDTFLLGLVKSAILRYLAVAHFGRGRGNWVESEAPVYWKELVSARVEHEKTALRSMFSEARKGTPEKASYLLSREVSQITGQILQTLYPG